jgi:hypothetical protein
MLSNHALNAHCCQQACSFFVLQHCSQVECFKVHWRVCAGLCPDLSATGAFGWPAMESCATILSALDAALKSCAAPVSICIVENDTSKAAAAVKAFAASGGSVKPGITSAPLPQPFGVQWTVRLFPCSHSTYAVSMHIQLITHATALTVVWVVPKSGSQPPTLPCPRVETLLIWSCASASLPCNPRPIHHCMHRSSGCR